MAPMLPDQNPTAESGFNQSAQTLSIDQVSDRHNQFYRAQSWLHRWPLRREEIALSKKLGFLFD